MNAVFFYFLNNLAGKNINFDCIAIFFASYLQYWLVAGVLLFLILGKDKRGEFRNLVLVGLSVFLSRVVITELIRFFYQSARPFVNNEVYSLISHEATGSFPSGHAAFFFALAMAVCFKHKKWSTVFFVGAAFMGISRIIVGVHWPIDILAGAVVGIISAWAVKVALDKYFKLA